MAIDYKFWHYTPSIAGAVIATIIFALVTGFHMFRLFKNRTWFCLPFVIGGLFETIGYAARGAAHSDTKSVTPYVIQSLLILLAPILFAGSIYMILGRIIQRTAGSSLSIIRPQWVTRIFVAGDVLCFLMQSSGGGLLAKAKTQEDVDMAQNIVLGGLILQIFIFGFFVVVAGVWHARLGKNPTGASKEMGGVWKKWMWMLYAVSACITARNICRVVEYGIGQDGYLMQHEWTLYIYDFLLMIITLAICIQWYEPNIQISAARSNDVEVGPWN
ncbi:RTA1 like protein [Delitschia confertaspora ATCC 74209]|uniref:RTA1 like protein n=1 Tax=Delitschia confertaspora ATCC 74209 TaxID=1513339 RepID=A0A9P4JC18_9PLEO|nr:RTA1 like protein [Delitschia confertaspora ATCC 74209]